MNDQRDIRSPEVPATILVVDDHSSIVKLCQAVLVGAGFTVLGTDDSSEALKICTQHQKPIDLLLTDLVLPPASFELASTSNPFPYLNGYQLAVRAATIRNGLRIILMSGNPDKELLDHGITRGSLPFLAKPFGKDDLVDLIREVLSQPAPALTRSGANYAGPDVDWFG
jgi:CheY-like chemotaxis protein